MVERKDVERSAEKVKAEAERVIERGRELGITLVKADLRWSDAMGITIDGMPADQWLEAVGME
ncbi:hypothetical protein TR51_25695 [Kitasatospora griseola]|uniref:Uncharacterized protein n=1 Tax=Kitasatospora griseola TaxID=2064 RepID=A0A0D0PUX7_KITGR|nr:hypothetical protein [Kitasatospora griseola]KIQ61490.1 hypothetical protein TR51_35570 [Kitasatospora griseola]KIQ62433.1 hypothetical protein TR51_25695 [Kitasatospora griseola]